MWGTFSALFCCVACDFNRGHPRHPGSDTSSEWSTAAARVEAPQPHLAARLEAEELLRRLLHEVVAIDPDFASDRDLAGAGLLVAWVVLDVLPFDHGGAVIVLGPVLNDELDRVDYGHPPPSAAV